MSDADVKYPHLRRWDSRDPATGTQNYMGGDYSDYFVAPCSRTRDTADEALTKSNWEAQKKELAEIAEESEVTWRVGEFSHWACGWYEIVLIHESATACLKLADELAKRKDAYPVLDESRYSEIQEEQCEEAFNDWGRKEVVSEILKQYEDIDLTEEDLEAWYEMRRSSDMPVEYPEGYMHNDLDFEAWLDVMFRNAAEYGNSGWYTTSDYAEVFAETDDGKSLRSTTLHRRESEKSS